MPELTLADVVALLLALSLNAYVLFGGADFGGGVWDLLARGPRGARQREVIADAIGPIWEGSYSMEAYTNPSSSTTSEASMSPPAQ